MEEKEVYVVVVLCKEVAQDAIRVTTFDLVGRQAEVDTLHKIPELSDRIPVESPAEREGRTIHKEQNELLKYSNSAKRHQVLTSLVISL